jgi:sulfotransferase family protein
MQSCSNPFLFVVGCPRSGTTLLQRMLNHHPQLAVSNDTHFIPRVLVDEVNPLVTSELIENVVHYKRFYRLGLDIQTAREIGERSHDFRQFVSGLYDAFASVNGKPFGGEKTPDYVKCLSLLHYLFPDSKFIHIIRDGRDVALSMLQWAATSIKGPSKFDLWRTNPVAVCALFWRWQVMKGLLDSAQMRRFYLEIRYEELVLEPETILKRIASFLELPYSDDMMRFYVGKTRPGTHLSAKSAWLPATPGLRNWRSQMAAKDVELFEALAGDLLDLFSYGRMFPQVSLNATAAAEQYRIQFENEVHQRAVPPAVPSDQYVLEK